MKKFAIIALSLSLVSTTASAVVIDVTANGETRRIDCGNQADLAASVLSQADKDSCATFFETAAAAGGAGAAGAGAGAGAAAGAGAFGLGGAGTLALAALGIALVAGFGGSSDTTTGSN
jgi:hypothetical protein